MDNTYLGKKSKKNTEIELTDTFLGISWRHKPTELMATTVELELRNFPADVQDILKQRAVERCVTIDVIIHDYVLETSKLIKESGAEAIGQEKPTIIKP